MPTILGEALAISKALMSPFAVSTQGVSLIWPFSIPLSFSNRSTIASTFFISSAELGLGMLIPSIPGVITASKSSSISPLPIELIRTKTLCPFRTGPVMASLTIALALAFSAVGTESSRSRTRTSVGRLPAFSIMFCRLPGTDNNVLSGSTFTSIKLVCFFSRFVSSILNCSGLC